MFDPKFEYCQVYEIAPTNGLDVPKGKIVINGIIHPSFLPTTIDIQGWLIDSHKEDFETLEQPWYLFQVIETEDINYEGLELDLPQWALEEVVGKAKKEKAEKEKAEWWFLGEVALVANIPEVGWLFRGKPCIILECKCLDEATESYKYYIEVEHRGDKYKTWIRSDLIEI